MMYMLATALVVSQGAASTCLGKVTETTKVRSNYYACVLNVLHDADSSTYGAGSRCYHDRWQYCIRHWNSAL
jgi:hypothetical protein